MSANRATQIGFCEVAITNKDVDAFKDLIEKDPALLDAPYTKVTINCNTLGILDGQLFIYEYILIESNHPEFVAFILSKLSQEKLLKFLQKKFFGNLKRDNTNIATSMTGLHVIAAKGSQDTIKAILQQCPDNIDTLLNATTTPDKQHVLMTASSANNNHHFWRLFYEKAVDKNKLLLYQSNTKSLLIHFVLHFDQTSVDFTPLLNVPETQQAAYLQTHNENSETLFHQIAATPTNVSFYPARFELFKKATTLLQTKVNKQEIATLFFLNPTKEKSPYSLAAKNNNDALMSGFLQFINYDNYTELKQYFKTISDKLNTKMFEHVSIRGLYNLIVLYLEYTKLDIQALLQLFINKFPPNNNELSEGGINKINELLNTASHNTRSMITNMSFSFYTVMSKLPTLVLSEPSTLTNSFGGTANWIYRKILLDMLLGVEKEIIETNKLPSNINNKLTWLSENADISLRQLFKQIKLLFENANQGFTLINGGYGNAQNNNRFAEALGISKKLPEGYFLLALCHRYGKGTGINASNAVYYSTKAHNCLISELNQDLPDDGTKKYLRHFKEVLLTRLCHYADTAITIKDKRIIAIQLAEILFNAKDYKGCRKYVSLVDDPKDSQTLPLEANHLERMCKLYLSLSHHDNQGNKIADAQRALELQYGPRFIEIANEHINHPSSSNFPAAALHYYRALTTANSPQIQLALEGLKQCLLRNNTPEIVKHIENTLHYIRKQLESRPADYQSEKLKDQKTYFQDFLEFSIKNGFMISHIILARLHSQNDYQFISKLINLGTGGSQKDEKLKKDGSFIQELHKTITPELQTLLKQAHNKVHHYKIHICLALIHFDLEHSSDLKRACENADKIKLAIEFLTPFTFDQSPCFNLIRERATRMLFYINNHKTELTKPPEQPQRKYVEIGDLNLHIEPPFSPLSARKSTELPSQLSHPLQTEQGHNTVPIVVQPLKTEQDSSKEPELYPSLSTSTQSSNAFVITKLRQHIEEQDKKMKELEEKIATQQSQLWQQQQETWQQQEKEREHQNQLQVKEIEIQELHLQIIAKSQEINDKSQEIDELKKENLRYKSTLFNTVSITNTLAQQLQGHQPPASANLPSQINN